MTNFTESIVEDAALAWLESLGYAVKHLPAPQNNTTRQAGGPDIAPRSFSLSGGNSCKKCNSSIRQFEQMELNDFPVIRDFRTTVGDKTLG